MSRRHNPRLAKLNRNYTVEEVARLYDVHRNTVRHWLKRGLPAVDDRLPTLILGRELRVFHTARRCAARRPSGPGQAFCLRCRAPRSPLGGVAHYEPLGPGHGNLVGTCESCGCRIFRRVTLSKLDAAKGQLAVSVKSGSDT